MEEVLIGAAVFEILKPTSRHVWALDKKNKMKFIQRSSAFLKKY